MPDDRTNSRPAVISIVCILGWVGSAFAILSSLLLLTLGDAVWMWVFSGIAAVVGAVILIGIWRMRRWAVLAYTGLFVVGQIALLLLGLWNIFSLFPVFILLVFWYFYPEMSSPPDVSDDLCCTIKYYRWPTAVTVLTLCAIGIVVAFGWLVTVFNAGDFDTDSSTETQASSTRFENVNALPTQRQARQAEKLRSVNLTLADLPSDFRQETLFASSSDAFRLFTDGELAHSVTFANESAKKAKQLSDKAGGSPLAARLASSQSEREALEDTQHFYVRVSLPEESLDSKLADYKENMAELKDSGANTVFSLMGAGVEAVSLEETVGSKQFGWRISLGSSSFMDHFVFYRKPVLVFIGPYVSLNKNSFSELILPKARLIDERIQNTTFATTTSSSTKAARKR